MAESRGQHPKKQILCIDDDPDILGFLQVVLEGGGYVFFGADSHAASEILFHKGMRPSLILLDIEMPEMDGFETLAALQKNHGEALAPVLFLTAKTDVDFITRSQKEGAVGYIIKPVNAHRLVERIEQFTALRKPILPYE